MNINAIQSILLSQDISSDLETTPLVNENFYTADVEDTNIVSLIADNNQDIEEVSNIYLATDDLDIETDYGNNITDLSTTANVQSATTRIRSLKNSQTEIADRKEMVDEALEDLHQEKESIQNHITMMQERAEELTQKIEDLTLDAIARSNSSAQEYRETINSIIEGSIEDYKSGDSGGLSLKEMITSRMGNVTLNNGKTMANIMQATGLDTTLIFVCAQMEPLFSDLSSINSNINSLTTEQDSLSTQLATINDALETQIEIALNYTYTMGDTTAVVNKENMTAAIPWGHSAEAQTYYAAVVELLLECGVTSSGESSMSISRTDPIGFKSGTTAYNFVDDDNNNGIFDDYSEFLGADDGWSELVDYDLDGNGSIEGSELSNLQVLKTDSSTGKNSIISAQEAGISSVDLNSYKELNEEQTNGNLLAGTFDIEFNGQTIEGQQTFDTKNYLDDVYGDALNLSFDGNINQNTTLNDKLSTDTYNPFYIQQNVKNLQNISKSLVLSARLDVSGTTAESLNYSNQAMGYFSNYYENGKKAKDSKNKSSD